jgi:hypothetical protein
MPQAIQLKTTHRLPRTKMHRTGNKVKATYAHTIQGCGSIQILGGENERSTTPLGMFGNTTPIESRPIKADMMPLIQGIGLTGFSIDDDGARAHVNRKSKIENRK